MENKELDLAAVFRKKPQRTSVGALKLNDEKPAFYEWASKLQSGAKLPRGKYFRKYCSELFFIQKNKCL